jgi:protoheme IX farnesyltransferase
MLPVVASFERTAAGIVAYSFVLWLLSLLFAPIAGMGVTYLVSAVALGGAFCALGIRLQRSRSPQLSMRLFSFSISYLSLLFLAMVVDQLVRTGW